MRLLLKFKIVWGSRFEEKVAHVLWWVLHVTAAALIISLPSDFTVSKNLGLQHWLVSLILSLTVLAHYSVRLSNPGWCTPPTAADFIYTDPKHKADGVNTTDSATRALGSPQCENEALQPMPPASLIVISGLRGPAADPEAGAAPTVHLAIQQPYSNRRLPVPLLPTQCSQCGCLRRSPATTHCRYCNWCIEGFDHHCLWLGVCVGGRNHHLFARYVTLQAATCFLGFHYTLTACGRHHNAGGRTHSGRIGATWPYLLLGLLGLLTLLLTLLAVTHILLVLTGQTSRQVVQRVRGYRARRANSSEGSGSGNCETPGDGSSNGDGNGCCARHGGGSRSQIEEWSKGRLSSVAVLHLGPQHSQQHQQRLTASIVLANAAWLLCGVRPAWLGRSSWVQRADGLVAAFVNNEYYSCC